MNPIDETEATQATVSPFSLDFLSSDFTNITKTRQLTREIARDRAEIARYHLPAQPTDTPFNPQAKKNRVS